LTGTSENNHSISRWNSACSVERKSTVKTEQ
jgi:hypothetical protein